MTSSAPAMIAEFGTPERLLAAIRRVRDAGHRELDAFAPFAVEGLSDALRLRPTRIRIAMAAGAVLGAGGAYLLEWLSAVVLYPLNTGGRPFHSWPVFTLVPFEVGVLAAAIAGLLAFLWSCGLPRLHHPHFAVPGFERASQDRFFLLVADAGRSDAERRRLHDLLESVGAASIRDLPP